MNKEQTIEIMQETLETFYDNCQSSAAEKIVNESLESKKKLMKHLTKEGVVHGERFKIGNGVDVTEIKRQKNDLIDWIEWKIVVDQEDSRRKDKLIYFIYNYVSEIDFKENRLSCDYKINEKKIINKGMKFSKAISLFFDLKGERGEQHKEIVTRIQDRYSLYRQKLADTNEGRITLSVHPLDFLTMSDNNHRWSSCHSTINGDYRVGNLNYMTDEVSMVAYFSDGDFDEKLEVLNNRKWNSKKWRVLIHLKEVSKGKWVVLYNRQYPYQDGNLLEKLDDLVQKTFKIKKETTTFVDDIDLEKEYGLNLQNFLSLSSYYTGYSDLSSGTEGHMRIYNGYLDGSEKPKALKVGGFISCLSCGYEPAFDSYSGECMECSGSWECVECGGSYHQDDMVFSEILEDYVCQDCFSYHFAFCDCCGEEVRYEEIETSPVRGFSLCSDCTEDLKEGGLELTFIFDNVEEIAESGMDIKEIQKLFREYIHFNHAGYRSDRLTIKIFSKKENYDLRNEIERDTFFGGLYGDRDIIVDNDFNYLKSTLASVVEEIPSDYKINSIDFKGIFLDVGARELMKQLVTNTLVERNREWNIPINDAGTYIL